MADKIPGDSADDGVEITFLRTRSERFYRMVITQAQVFHKHEEEHIFDVERQFCKKVGFAL